jgi:hypothetical protein
MKRVVGLVAAAALLLCGPALAAEAPPPVEAQGVLTPQILLFGDTLSARVDVTVDTARIDPTSVRVRTDFAPWELVEPPVHVRRDGLGTAYLSTTFVLRCLTSPCVPPRDAAPLDFDPALVTYAGNGRLPVQWPRLVVHSRIPDRGVAVGAAGGARRGPPQFPWQADVVSLPAVSYRLPPAVLLALLLAGGALLTLTGAGLAYRALPPRRVAPEPLPAPPPEPPLPPLERALVLLEDPQPQDGTADRRRALELVAEALAGRDEELAAAARTLAWSEHAPPPSDTTGLAARARAALGPLLEEAGDGA